MALQVNRHMKKPGLIFLLKKKKKKKEKENKIPVSFAANVISSLMVNWNQRLRQYRRTELSSQKFW